MDAKATEFVARAIWSTARSATGLDHLGRSELSLSEAIQLFGLADADFLSWAQARLPGGMDATFLPLRLVAVWISIREREQALETWCQSATLRRPITLDWREGLDALLRELIRGKLVAWGYDRLERRRRIDPDEWPILKSGIIGSSDVLFSSSTRFPEYGRVELRGDDVLRLWPAEPETTRRVRHTCAAEKRVKAELCKLMRNQPTQPIPKAALAALPIFQGVTDRALGRIFTNAVRETGAVAWSKGGRRPRSR